MDIRIQKTKNKIKTSLLNLLENNNLSEISVSQLCSKAEINRSTFYVHYNNIADCFSEITDKIIDEMRKMLYSEARQTPETLLRVYFRIAQKHQIVFRVIHTTGIHNPMIHKMVELSQEAMHWSLFIPQHSENLEYSFIFSGFYGMVEAWLRNGCTETEDELLAIMRNIYPMEW